SGALHAAHIRPGARLGHGEAVGLLSANRGEEIFLALLAFACHQDVGRPRHAVPMQCIVGTPELALIHDPGLGIEAGAAGFGGHIGGIEAGGDRLGLELLIEVLAQFPGALDLRLMREELVLDEISRRLDDHALFFAESEIHGRQLPMWKVSEWPSTAMAWPVTIF